MTRTPGPDPSVPPPRARRAGGVATWRWRIGADDLVVSADVAAWLGAAAAGAATPWAEIAARLDRASLDALRGAQLRAAQGEEVGEFELHLTTHDGRNLVLLGRAERAGDGDAEVRGVFVDVTDYRRRLRETFLEAEVRTLAADAADGRSALALSVISEGVWEWPLGGDVAYLSPRFKAILGHPPDGFPDRFDAVLDAIHDDDRPRVRARLQAHVAGRGAFDEEFRARTADGAWRWVRARGEALRDAAGRPARVIGTLADVDARHRAAESLARERRRLEQAERMARIGHFSWEPATEAAEWSPQLYAIFGVSPDADPPHREAFDARVHPDDLPHLHDAVARALAGTDALDVEYRWRRGDGALLHLHLLGEVERDGAGRAVRLFGTVQDVTERVRGELALRESRAFLEAIAAAIPATIYIFDLVEGRNRYANREIARMLGYTPEEIRALGPALLAQVVHPDDLPGLGAFFDGLRDAADGEVREQTFRVRTKHGELRWQTSQVTPFERGPDGRVRAVVGIAEDVTERVAHAEALREWEALLRRTQALAKVGTWSWEIAADRVRWSEETYRIFGVAPGTPVDFAMVEAHVHPDDRALQRARVEATLATGAPYALQLRVLGEDGGARVVQVLGELERDASGRPARLLGSAQDITETQALLRALQDAGTALRESEARFRAMAATVPVGIFLTDDRGRNVFVNPAHAEMLGLDPADAAGDGWLRAIPPDELASTHDDIRRRLERREPLERDGRFRHADGREVLVHVKMTPLFDGDAFLGYVGMAEDITARRRHEQALRESEERFRTLAEHAPLGIYVTDPAGRTSYVNPRLGAIWEQPVETLLVDGGFLDRLHPEDRPRVEVTDESARRAPRAMVQEYRLLLPGDRVKWIRDHVAPLRDGAGVVRGFVGTVEDVSDVRRAEQERLELERQFQQSQKLESLGVLAGGIAHDFNNLLVGILGNASLALLELPEGSTAAATLQDIERASRRAADLVRQLLAYAGKGRFVIEPTDISQLVQEMAALLRAAIGPAITLDLRFSPDLPAVRGDATQLRQVVMNLITNASEAIGNGPGTVAVRTGLLVVEAGRPWTTQDGQPLPPGTYVRLEVTDNGCGMEPGTMQRIFEPFFTTKRTGRGLGLAATLGIVRGHDGGLRLRSAPGAGTTVEVLLPAGDAPAPEAAGGAGPQPQPALAGEVLVIDDDEGVRHVAGAVLRRLGLAPVLAASGEEGVARYREGRGRIRLVLLDLTMPTMSGQQALAEIRAADPAARVILMSGYSEQDVSGRLTGERPDGFIEKPFDLPTFTDAVRRALDAGS